MVWCLAGGIDTGSLLPTALTERGDPCPLSLARERGVSVAGRPNHAARD